MSEDKGPSKVPRVFETDRNEPSSGESDVATDWTDPETEYQIEYIAAERTGVKGGTEYLIKWQDYPIGECSWEPAKSIGDCDVVHNWLEHKRAVAKGFKDPFDMAKFETESAKYQETLRKKYKQRLLKRHREGLPIKWPRKRIGALPEELRLELKSVPPPQVSGKVKGARRLNKVRNTAQTSEDSPPINTGGSVGVFTLSEDEDELPLASRRTSALSTKGFGGPTPILADDSLCALPLSVRILSDSSPTDIHLPSRRDDIDTLGTSYTGALVTEPLVSMTSTPMRTATETAALNITQPGFARGRKKSLVGDMQPMPLQSDESSRPFVSGDNDVLASNAREPIVNPGRVFRNLRHVNNALKKSRREAVINPSNIQLRDLSGTVVSEPSGQFQGQSWSHPVPASPLLAGRAAAEQQRIPFWPKRDESKHAMIPLTCPYFGKGIQCPDTSPPCPFIHRLASAAASFDLYDQWRAYCNGKVTYPKFATPTKVCSYWRNKGCFRQIDDCWDAHWHPLGLRIIDSLKEKTCFFWLNGTCKKEEQICRFAHEIKPEIADPPPAYQNRIKTRENIQHQVSKPDRINDFHCQDVLQVDSLPTQTPTPPAVNHHSEGSLARQMEGSTFQLPAILELPKTYSHLGLIDVEIDIADPNLQALLSPSDGKPLRLYIEKLVLGVNFHSFVGKETALGAIRPRVESSTWRLFTFADTLDRYMGGAVADLGHLTLNFFPPRPRSWQDFNVKENPTDLEIDSLVPLKVCFSKSPMPESAPLLQAPRTETRATTWTQVLQERYGIQARTSLGGHWGIPNGRHVFLFLSRDRRVEQELWKRYLCENQRYVYFPEAGSWEAFCNKKVERDDRKLVIFHSDFHLFSAVPNFATLLLKSNYSIFQLEYETSERAKNAGAFHIIPLFTHGTAVLITDELYQDRPKEALAILTTLIAENSKRKPGQKWRLCARHGLKPWLRSLVDAHYEEYDDGEKGRLALYEYCCQLITPEEEDELTGEPLAYAPLVTLSKEAGAEYAILWERSRHAALEKVVDWFAGEWSIASCRLYRRFVVVHPEPPERWVEKYQHVSFMKPEAYLNTLASQFHKR